MVRPSRQRTNRYKIDSNSIQRSSTTDQRTKSAGQALHRVTELQRVKVNFSVDWRSALLLVELLNPIAEIIVLLDQPSQLGLNTIKEGILWVPKTSVPRR
jgi:hypothetical protein